MLSQIQRFGAAMFTPVLLFPFAGIIVGLTIVLKNPVFVGELANPDSLFYQIMYIIEEGGWTVFRNMPLIFAIALPIGLANTAQGRACLVTLVAFLTWNYFINAIATQWGTYFAIDMSQEAGGVSGLTYIAGIKTLDTSIIGAIFIASITTWLHNRYYEKPLPTYLGIFQGTSFVAIIAFFVVLPLAYLTVLIWPKVQSGIYSLQDMMIHSGVVGIWIYTFLERILIPTGLHHFIYGPFIFGPAVVEGGVQLNWAQHIAEFSQATEPLKALFPAGGFALHGNSKIFGCIGIALAIYSTAKKENRAKIAGLLIPATLTAVFVGITEPLEFTFLFIAPLLFFIHALLAATMSALMYYFGVVGNFGGGLIEFITQNWLPMFHNHADMMFIQIAIGSIFTLIWFITFRTLILKLNLNTPGRNNSDIKLYTKSDVNNQKSQQGEKKQLAEQYIDALGGAENIKDLANCATRLRFSLIDPDKMYSDEAIKALGAHGVVHKGHSKQIIIGLHVPQLCDQMKAIIHRL